MLPNEAKWFAERIARFDPLSLGNVVNLGSGSLEYRTSIQPYIEAEILGPLTARGVEVINVDAKEDEGVEVVGSIFDELVQQRVRAFKPHTVICQNMLEHVPDPTSLARICEDLIPSGGYLMVSVPHRFPYHPDPIDTKYRPTPEDLASAFQRCELIEAEVVAEAPLEHPPYFGSPLPWIKVAASLVVPYRSTAHLRASWSRALAWGRPCSVTCAILQKVATD